MESPIAAQEYPLADRRGHLPTRPGAEPYAARALGAITMAVIHYSGVDADHSAAQIAAYQVGKTEGDLFPAIAYHFVVRQNGEIEQCHDLATRAWHAGSAGNESGVGICLPMLHGPTTTQVEACARLVATLRQRLGRVLAVVGHCDLMPTACPGPAWPLWRRLATPPVAAPRELAVGGIPIKWAFHDAYRRMESLRPGLCGAPEGPPRPLGGGDAVQEFAGCTMLWSEQRLWLAFK
ncbi:MAG: peptidoglycan recognition protein family protein [Chloroflexota bacterium]